MGSSGAMDGSHTAAQALDENEGSKWVSHCLACGPDEAWIGVDFGYQVSIGCVYLVQSSATMQQCAQIALEFSETGAYWTERYRYGFGTHALTEREKLQADLDTVSNDEDLWTGDRKAPIWRLVCDVELMKQWGVFELTFFDDPDCSSRLRGGIETFLHSLSASHPVENAFDSRPYTLWKTGCGKCDGDAKECLPCRAGKTYLGAKFKRLVHVMCVKLHQVEIGQGGCKTVSLQFSMTGDEGSWKRRQTFKRVGVHSYLLASQTKGEDTGAGSFSHSFMLLQCWITLLITSWIFKA